MIQPVTLIEREAARDKKKSAPALLQLLLLLM
jgi:hypothetical protein